MQTDLAVQDETRQRLTRARRRWIVIPLCALVFLAAVYWLAVRTRTGQAVENAALYGADQVDPRAFLAATRLLDTITVTSLAAATLLVGLIGLLRRQVSLAVAAMAVILGSQAATQILKFLVLQRPNLLDTDQYLANTLPSGHTTAAMSVLFATLIVMPYRFRGVAMFFALSWAVGIGAYTVIAQWHRLSDTLAADAVALVVACAASYFLARTGRIREVVTPGAARYTLRTVFVATVAVVGAAAATLGAVALLAALDQNLDSAAEWRLFLSAQWLAAAGSIFAALLFWWSWHRVETKRRGDPSAVR
ncbi:phosphatase PAP2 family protein [Mycobacterium sp. ITM-2016-00317]|uniref:phosphatase PAP2 family protein n=1 Tax=Mycobacterium sp. ITM-2016-00317 TaxID=2099694 RepID=UPI00287F49F3|nr:phosphatase PAP2 family protein [Mycobacterium sp. ITM-2016-00317]WNG87147.1 phosphatase PAP2 family protein [Mycobacterium sp. ITM-2016-00317]